MPTPEMLEKARIAAENIVVEVHKDFERDSQTSVPEIAYVIERLAEDAVRDAVRECAKMVEEWPDMRTPNYDELASALRQKFGVSE